MGMGGDMETTGSMTASSINVEQLYINGDTITQVISSDLSLYDAKLDVYNSMIQKVR